jgi:hypothetical protein
MKFALALLSLIAGVSANMMMPQMDSIKADSPFGRKLLEKARNLDDQAFANTWLSGYSLKFEGCHHISQWNNEADGEEDVRIATKRLVRFRLCPSDFCDSSKGCSSGYGDYIVDMNTYLAAWFEAKQTYQEFKCSYLMEYVCVCEDNGDGNYNADECMWDCLKQHNMASVCMGNDPYGNGNDQQAQFSLDDYMECSQTYFNRRELANNNNGNGK